MIIVNIGYGLGNQMFQYAFGKALSMKKNDRFLISKTYYDNENGLRKFGLDRFVLFDNVDLVENHKLLDLFYSYKYNKKDFSRIEKFILGTIDEWFLPFEILSEDDTRTFKEVSYKHKKINVYSGAFQCEKYFDEIKNELKNDFQLKNVRKEIQEYGAMLRDTNSVCLHIRRTDYVGNVGLDVCNVAYYKLAIEQIKEKIPYAKIYAFSDDIKWVENTIEDVIPVNFTNDAFEDLYLMIQCKNFIISNSTFSWWAQYLSDNEKKIVIAPVKWFKNERTVDDCIYQKNWTILDFDET